MSAALEPPMPDASVLSLRLPADILDRADALIPVLQADPAIAAMAGGRGVTRALVIRLALTHGLETLETKFRPIRLNAQNGP